MRKSEQHIDFDLDLAVSQSKDNAVYYIQYAHARICRMLEKAASTDLHLM
jgi:arginyl-tRNA synthetase